MREDIKLTLQKLKPLIGKKAEALWYLYQSSDYKEKSDVEIKINLIAEKYLKVFQDKIELPPLTQNEAEGDFKIGEITYVDKKIYDFSLRKDELLRHIGIFGQTGSGKTVASLNFIKELCKKNKSFLIKACFSQMRVPVAFHHTANLQTSHLQMDLIHAPQ